MADSAGGVVAAIFDMDGLLADTETLWRRAELEVLRPLGVPLDLDMCAGTSGLRIDAVVAHWRARFPWSGPSTECVAGRIVDQVIVLFEAGGRAMPGAAEAVEGCLSAGLELAVATSSPLRLAEPVLRGAGLARYFERVFSAEYLALGKPHPEVYLDAAGALGVEASACIAFEDSLNGVIAAKAARMTCVAVPEAAKRDDPRFALADVRLDSLRDFEPFW